MQNLIYFPKLKFLCQRERQRETERQRESFLTKIKQYSGTKKKPVRRLQSGKVASAKIHSDLISEWSLLIILTRLITL